MTALALRHSRTSRHSRGASFPATNHLAHSQRPRLRTRGCQVTVENDDNVRARRGTNRFPQPPHWQHATAGDLARPRHQDVHIARQLDVLKAIVQQMHRGAQPTFCQCAGEKTIVAHRDHRVRQAAGKHERLVARVVDVSQQSPAIRNDDHTVVPLSSTVPTAENRRAFTLLQEPMSDQRHHRCLTGSTDTQIADADHRLLQPSSRFRVALEPAPPDSNDLRI